MFKPLYIVWKDEFNTNIPIVDEQHRAIASTINSLYYFIQEGWEVADLEPTLNIISTYAKFHARTEEGMLHKTECQSIDDHYESYRVFEMEFARARQQAEDFEDSQILLSYLRKWWHAHLNVEHEAFNAFYEETL